MPNSRIAGQARYTREPMMPASRASVIQAADWAATANALSAHGEHWV